MKQFKSNLAATSTHLASLAVAFLFQPCSSSFGGGRISQLALHTYEPHVHFMYPCPDEMKFGVEIPDELQHVMNGFEHGSNMVQCISKQFGHISVTMPATLTSLQLEKSEWHVPATVDGVHQTKYFSDKIIMDDLLIDPVLRDAFEAGSVYSVVGFPVAAMTWRTQDISKLFTAHNEETKRLEQRLGKRMLAEGKYAYWGCADTCKLGKETANVRPSPNCMDLRTFVAEHVVEESRDEFVIVNIGAAGTFAETDSNRGKLAGGDPLSSLFTAESINSNGKQFKALAVDANYGAAQELANSFEALKPQIDDNLELLIGIEQKFVSPNDIHDIVRDFITWARAERIDIFKIDIDSFECDVMLSFLRDASPEWYPRTIVVELQPVIPPPYRFSLLSSDEFARAAQNWTYGEDEHIPLEAHHAFPSCSLSYAVEELTKYGYHLYKFNGDNAVFVNEPISKSIEATDPSIQFPIDETFCYYQSPIHAFAPWLDYAREWMTDPDIVGTRNRIWANITQQHRAIGLRDGHQPFTLDVS